MAITARILVQIILMIILSPVKILQRPLLDRQLLRILRLHGGIDRIDDGQVTGVHIIDARTILRSTVVPLLVDAHGIDGFEIQFQQQLQGNDRGIIHDPDGLRKTRQICANILITRILRMSVGIAGLGFQDTAYLLEIVLGTPKTTPGHVDFFLHSPKLGKNTAFSYIFT